MTSHDGSRPPEPDKITYFAHSANDVGRWEPLHEHLLKVADKAAKFASVFGCEPEARLSGLLHDLGKYSDRFHRRLLGQERGLDHWSLGAYLALREYKMNGIAAALVIQGHHIGLQRMDNDSLKELSPQFLQGSHPLGLTVTEPNVEVLLNRFLQDGLNLPASLTSRLDIRGKPAEIMLDVRLLFSALADADFLETEAHFQSGPDGSPKYRTDGPTLEAERALQIMLKHLGQIRQSSKASKQINEIRSDLLDACLMAAEQSGNLLTLSAPTGSGKTLAMLAFALRRAQVRQLRRIVVVIPYLSIIDQTARIYREIFEPIFGERYVLEHHSLAGTREALNLQPAKDMDTADEGVRAARLLSENWDAPIVVTTSVQCLESLFSNRPSCCRKLHRLAKSVILFDEVQTLPERLAIPTLATLSHLAERYEATVVFSTATQPAFTHLDAEVRKYASAGWRTREIVPENLNLFGRSRRTQVTWPDLNSPLGWADLADELSRHPTVLCIVNLKGHAAALTKLLKQRGVLGLYHLSTNMCPAHRVGVLGEIRTRLEDGQPCCLISTQCVEAGVDLDFPVVYRAFGPLEAIAQAAGRSNRNANLPQLGEVRVFLPEDESYPGGGYKQAAGVARMLLQSSKPASVDIDDPSLFRKYYERLYDLTRPADQNKKLRKALKLRDFPEVAANYQVIDARAVNALVPYNLRVYRTLADEIRETHKLSRGWMRKAQPYSVSLPRYSTIPNLEPVPLTRNSFSEDWFIYVDERDYDSQLGLVLPDLLMI